MIDLSPEADPARRWIVCESGDRWLTAARRFVPALMPPPLVPEIIPAESSAAVGLVRGPGRAIVLWEVRPDWLAGACQRLAQTAVACPWVLQLVAEQGLSDRDRLLLAEFPAAAMIQHPEQLDRLKPILHGYFAEPGQAVD